MKLLKNKKFYASILIDLSFLIILYYFVLFMFEKIQSYTFLLQGLSSGLANFNPLQENVSQALLLNNLELAGEMMQRIILFYVLTLAGIFLLYLLFQGIQWSYILSKSNKNYFLKFSFISLFSYLASLYLLWHIILNFKPLLINYFEGVPIYNLILKTLVLFILLLVLWYYTIISYVLSSKYKLIEALKKTFLLNNLKSALIYTLSVVLILSILFFFPVFKLYGTFYIIIEITLILLIVSCLRYYLVRVLEK